MSPSFVPAPFAVSGPRPTTALTSGNGGLSSLRQNIFPCCCRTTRCGNRAMRQGTLLLVDDDRLVLDGMAAWLDEQGYQVHTANGRQAALAQLDERRFDLVLADICLADGDGFEIL